MRQCPRAGFTLVELIVALLLLCSGVLALCAAARVSLRMVGTSGARERAAAVADARFERLAAAGCAGAAGGTRYAAGVLESWSVARDGRALIVADTLRVRLASGTEVIAFAAVLPCAP